MCWVKPCGTLEGLCFSGAIVDWDFVTALHIIMVDSVNDTLCALYCTGQYLQGA